MSIRFVRVHTPNGRVQRVTFFVAGTVCGIGERVCGIGERVCGIGEMVIKSWY